MNPFPLAFGTRTAFAVVPLVALRLGLIAFAEPPAVAASSPIAHFGPLPSVQHLVALAAVPTENAEPSRPSTGSLETQTIPAVARPPSAKKCR